MRVARGVELLCSYLAAMELARRYAYAGRDWVVERVRRIIGGGVTESGAVSAIPNKLDSRQTAPWRRMAASGIEMIARILAHLGERLQGLKRKPPP